MARRALSYSQVRTFSECKWRYREVVLHKAPTLRAPALDFGALEHEAIQAYLLHLIQTRQDFAPQDVPQVWDRFARGYVWVIPEDRWTEARRLLERFARDFRLEVDTVWDTEPRMAVSWEGEPVEWWDPRAWVRGRPDLVRVQGFVADVDDWKTNWAPSPSIDENFQAQTYAWLLHLWNRKLDVIRVHFRFVRWNLVRSATFYEPDFKETEARWRQLSDQVEAAVAEIENEKVWAPTPGPHCVGCPVLLRCPLGIPALGEPLGLPTDPAQAQAQAARLLVLDAAREPLREGLRAWVKTSGRVTVNGEAFDFYPSARWDYDIWEVVRLAKQHFVDPYLVLTVSAEKLKALLKKERPFVEAVEAKARRDMGTPAFTHRKVKDEPADA